MKGMSHHLESLQSTKVGVGYPNTCPTPLLQGNASGITYLGSCLTSCLNQSHFGNRGLKRF